MMLNSMLSKRPLLVSLLDAFYLSNVLIAIKLNLSLSQSFASLLVSPRTFFSFICYSEYTLKFIECSVTPTLSLPSDESGWPNPRWGYCQLSSLL